MTAFRDILAAKNRIPERHVVLKKDAFAETWEGKPPEDLALGLRKISDTNIQTARAEAAKYAVMMHQDREGQIECFNDALMRWAIVYGTCDANDIDVQAQVFSGSEENVRNALTSQAIRFVWDELERYHIETSPLVVAATDEQIEQLGKRLAAKVLPGMMTVGAMNRSRKLLAFVLQEIIDAEGMEEEIIQAVSGQPDTTEEPYVMTNQ